MRTAPELSGGSYNYLCHQLDARNHLDLADLEAMRDRLDELAPGSAAARDTAALHAALTAPVVAGLTEVWHDVEWFDSGDYSEDQARAEIAKYEHARRTDGEPEAVTEYGTVMSGGGVHIRPNNPVVDRAAPLAQWIDAERNINRTRVVRRRIIVLDEWEEVAEP